MIKIQSILSLAAYVPRASETIDDRAAIAAGLARMGADALVDELAERGFERAAIIEGLKDPVARLSADASG